MLQGLLAMAGLDENAIVKLKTDAIETAERLKSAESLLNQMSAKINEMHNMFFSMVPRPADHSNIQEAELINHADGETIELNTPESAFKIADPVINH